MGNYTIVTDAWDPQVNGVVTTYKNLLVKKTIISGDYCKKVPVQEISLAINPWKIARELKNAVAAGDSIHIATEGPLGLFARLYLKEFTTCYHSKFPEFIEKRFRIPAILIYPYFRWFHRKSKCVLVPTEGMKEFLASKGFKNLKVWTRGVDSSAFYPEPNPSLDYIVCVSRVSHEKGLDDFCGIEGYRKILVGDGPYLDTLKKKYPDVCFTGMQKGDSLRRAYANASCFVFPSLEDTFGVVLLEAIACGTPLVSYNSHGAISVIDKDNGIICDNLSEGVKEAIQLERRKVFESSRLWTWKRATDNFIEATSL